MLKVVALAIIFVAYPLFAFPLTDELEEQAAIYREEGYKRQNAGDVMGALSAYLKAIHTCPLCKEAYNDAGVAYETLGELNKAEEMYLRAIEVDSKYLPPYANLGFLYEKKNQPEKATIYWKERYLLGKQGEYWRQKARQHLIKLGTFPQARQEELAEEARVLSHNLSLERERQRKLAIKESKQHFELGTEAMAQGRYVEAEMQFGAILKLMPDDSELLAKAKEQYAIVQDYATRQKIQAHLKKAANHLGGKDLDSKDYVAMMKEIEKAKTLMPKDSVE